MPSVLRKLASSTVLQSPFTSSNSDSSDGIPQNILAFRTITKMLAIIQQERPFKIVEDGPKISAPDREELKLLSAFSSVAVVDHDVVAVVARQCPEKLEVVACGSTNEKLPQPTVPSNWWLFTKNFRRDDLEKTEKESRRMAKEERKRRFPVIQTTVISSALVGDSDERLRKYLEQRWGNPTLATHLGILTQLLAVPDDEHMGFNHLLSYIVASCYPKMLRRLTHKVSQRYLNFLKGATPSFNPPPELSEPKDVDQHDLRFLSWMHNLALENHSTRENYPKIVHQAKLAVAKEPFQIYTEDTYNEFHDLLLNFLDNFEESIKKLSKSCPPPDVPTGFVAFKNNLEEVYANGLGIQYLSRTAAFERYLKAFRLEDFRAKSSEKDGEHENPNEKDGECENSDERDEDLQAVQPFVTMENSKGIAAGQPPLWTFYKDWLRLLVVHFDAVEIISRYVIRSHGYPLSLNVLVPPFVDNALLPWKDLLYSTHFPKFDAPITTAGIVTFFEMAPRLLQTVKNAHTEWDKVKSPSGVTVTEKIVKATKKCIDTLQDMPDGWLKCKTHLSEMLNVNTVVWSGAEVDKITDMIESLEKSLSVILSIDTATKRGFSGTLHCEACLASLLTSYNIEDIQDDKFKQTLAQMKDFKRIIGVSKRCCPTCRYLLDLLTGHSQSFIVRGSHGTITACTLPTWLPKDIVNSMNQHFGDQLKEELLNLINRPESLRRRAASTGSERLSLESCEGHFRPGDGDGALGRLPMKRRTRNS